MNRDNLSVTLDVKVGIPVEQAQRALKIVEWFWNDNPDVDIVVDRCPSEDGFEKRISIKRFDDKR